MPAVSVQGQDLVIKVAGGCGPGWHPNPWGRCVPNRRVYGHAPPPPPPWAPPPPRHRPPPPPPWGAPPPPGDAPPPPY
ncbi:GCG_CRPN prefix-to-repeats domain-containing protein [Labrys monachus]